MDVSEIGAGSTYQAIVAASERVAWTVDAVFGGRRFDASRSIVPSSWVGADGLAFLTADERRILGHCRAFSYVHLLGNFEEFAPPHLGGIADQNWYDDRDRLRALFRFGDEEMKHQQLFRRAEHVLEDSCGHRFGRWFEDDKVRVTAVTEAILARSVLARFLMVLALELGTQRHYVESIRDRNGDPLYGDVLKAHWVEEAQHIKADLLEIARLAVTMPAHALRAAFDDALGIGAMVDAAFAGQAGKEVETLQEVTGRTFSPADATLLRDALHRSLSAIMAGVGLTHPAFARVALALSRDGAAALGIG